MKLNDTPSAGAPLTAASGGGMRDGGWLLVGSTAAISVINYAYTLVMIFLLSSTAFSHFALVSSLLLVAGTCASSVIPWVLAREVAGTATGAPRRQQAVGFAIITSLAGSIAAAVIIGLLAAEYASVELRLVSAAACFCIFLNAVGAGYLQGLQRFRLLALTRILEVVGKLALGVAIVLVSATAEAAVAGFALGAGGCALLGLWLMRTDLHRLSRATAADRDLWRDALGIGCVQALVSLLQALDVVVLGLAATGVEGVAGYQAMLILARIPVFVGVALSYLIFPQLAGMSLKSPHARTMISQTLRSYLALLNEAWCRSRVTTLH